MRTCSKASRWASRSGVAYCESMESTRVSVAVSTRNMQTAYAALSTIGIANDSRPLVAIVIANRRVPPACFARTKGRQALQSTTVLACSKPAHRFAGTTHQPLYSFWLGRGAQASHDQANRARADHWPCTASLHPACHCQCPQLQVNSTPTTPNP